MALGIPMKSVTLSGPTFVFVDDSMLESLNTVAWASLSQPDGNLPDTLPRALLGLAGCVSDEEATAAYHRFLFAVGNNHAGTYYPVVVATIPFLGELLESGQDATRRASLEALIDLIGSFEPAPGHETVDTGTEPPLDLRGLLADQVRVLLPILHVLAEDGACRDLTRSLARELCERLMTVDDGVPTPSSSDEA